MLPSSAGAAEPGGKNLKVLPATMSKADIKKVMKTYTAALGVKCDFCHDPDDMAADTNKHKGIAREMMKMTAAINKNHFGGKAEVSCVTCHNGKAEPKH